MTELQSDAVLPGICNVVYLWGQIYLEHRQSLLDAAEQTVISDSDVFNLIPMRVLLVYLLLAIVVVLTWQANLAFMAESTTAGLELQRFISDASATSQSWQRSDRATAVSLDQRGLGQHTLRWLGIVLSFGVAFACGAPFFCSSGATSLPLGAERQDTSSTSLS